ncbi:MAG: tetratricopeptide repeat protein [Lentisphaeria bacterium]|nr:tetratricopeptide repeat protein [Lentisphaeria bacterium]
MKKEPLPLTRQLAPLIIFIVLIIILTLIIRGSRLPENPEAAEQGQDLEMKLSPFSYQPPPSGNAAQAVPIQLPDPDSVVSAATRDAANGQYARSEDQLRTALVFYPGDRRILSLLGTVLYLQKKYEAAEGVFRHLTVLNPDDTEAYTNLGAVLAGQRRYREAIDSARKVYLKEPDSAIAALNLSSVYSLNGDTTEALEYFRKAYEKLGENILPLSYSSNFDNIRNEKVFQDIVREAQRKHRAAAPASNPSPSGGKTSP